MAEKTKTITSIGGQALVEGIMMRGPKITAVGVRKPDKTIDVSERPTENLKDKYPILGWPIIRGTAAMIDSMKIGFSALNESAEKSVEGLEEEEPSRFEKWLDRVFGEKIMNVIMGIAMVLHHRGRHAHCHFHWLCSPVRLAAGFAPDVPVSRRGT